MANDDPEERRGIDRRVFELEQRMQRLLTLTEVNESKINGIISTMDSRHKAFERGQELILERLGPLRILAEQDLNARIVNIEAAKNKAAGAMLMIQVLGITGVIGGIVAIVKLIVS